MNIMCMNDAAKKRLYFEAEGDGQLVGVGLCICSPLIMASDSKKKAVVLCVFQLSRQRVSGSKLVWLTFVCMYTDIVKSKRRSLRSRESFGEQLSCMATKNV